MKLYCLSGHPNLPCLVLKFKSVTVMLDCALDLTTTFRFLPLPLVHSARLAKLPSWVPKDADAGDQDTLKTLKKELKECAGRVFVDSPPEVGIPEDGLLDLSTVDVILVSSFQCILALPYITEYTGFNGTGMIYATEPTAQMGRQLMEELVQHTERVPKTCTASKWKEPGVFKMLPAQLRDGLNPASLRDCYGLHDVNSALSKVQLVGYAQKLDVFGALQIMPLSSGYCIGSCNWLIQSHYEKISYISSSSVLTTHPQPMDQGPLQNTDVLILAGLTQSPTANPDSMLSEFCSHLAVTVKNGGNVLVPCYPSGVVYDLFECLAVFLDNSGLMQLPVYFVSPMADSSLAYSNIFAEWLCQSKQSKVYLPEAPFVHEELKTISRLKVFPSVHGDFSSEFKTPCVVFAGHPTLRFGDGVHFMEIWGQSKANTVIFVEPDIPYLDALAPFQPLAMKAVHCPIDTRLSFQQANKIISDLKPLHVVLPETYITPPPSLPQRSDLVLEADPPPTTYQRGEVLSLPIKRMYEKIEITPELASALVPSEIRQGVAVASVTGVLEAKDNNYVLQSVPKQPTAGPGQKRKREDNADFAPPKPHVWGAVQVEQFVQDLEKGGVTDVKVEDTPSGHIIHLQSEDTLIQIEDGSTHIFCEGNEELRIKLRNILLKCLSKF
uniref:Integrator complex subunit 9 n=1 Tax=Branchiostoma floridae TaxID=7739 RepID=C3ZPU6_BRAFL|eukprot:XP_002589314.1 hypothetical protein BRAFLDRAFT_217919 [Branchiostoma floridae]